MKKNVVLLALLLMGLVVSANVLVKSEDGSNNTVDVKKMSKKELKAYEKRQKEIKDSTDHAEAVAAIKNGAYILIVDKTMSRVMRPEDSRRNFFIFDKNKITVQSGMGGVTSGNNNIGGITISSNVSEDIKIQEKKNGEVKVEFKIFSEYLSGRVNLKLDKKTNYGEIGILQSGNGQYAIMFGHIIPYDSSLIGNVIEIGKQFVPYGWNPSTLGAKRDVGVLMDYLQNNRSIGDKNWNPSDSVW